MEKIKNKRGEIVFFVVLGLLLLVGGIISFVDNSGNAITGAAIGLNVPDNSTLNEENVEIPALVDVPLEEMVDPTAEIFEVQTDSETINIQDNIGIQAACSSWPCACEDTINESMTMTSNLTGCVSDWGLNFNNNDIIFDCDGYTLEGDFNPLTNDYGLYITNYDNITLKNCNITGFNTGIYILNPSYNITIFNNTLVNNYEYGIAANVFDSLIYDNFIRNGTSSGIYISGNNSIVENNTALLNKYGFTISGDYMNVTNNNASYNNITFGEGFRVTGDNAVLRNNFAANNYYSGYDFDASSYGSLINNTAINNDFGLVIETSSGEDSYNGTILNNTFNNNTYGLYTSIHSTSLFENYTFDNNNFSNNTYHLDFDQNTILQYNHNITTNNYVDGKSIYYFYNQNDILVNFSDNPGVVIVINSSNVTINEINISNTYRGLLLHSVINCSIRSLNNSNNYYSIYLNNVDNCIFSNSDFYNGSYGIYLNGGDNVSFNNNQVHENSESGFQMYYLNNSNISGNNIFSHNGSGDNGIYLYNSFNNTIESNVVDDNYYGITLQTLSGENIIQNNNITNSILYSIFFNSITNHETISNNNVINSSNGFYLFSEIGNITFVSNIFTGAFSYVFATHNSFVYNNISFINNTINATSSRSLNLNNVNNSIFEDNYIFEDIYLTASSSNNFTNNTIVNSTITIDEDSFSTNFYNNSITLSGGTIIYAYGAEVGDVINNNLLGAIFPGNCNNFSNNTIAGASQVNFNENCTPGYNTLVNSTAYVTSSNVLLNGSNFQNSRIAILGTDYRNVTISYNNFTGAHPTFSTEAMALSYLNDSFIYNNDMSDLETGISFSSSFNNSIFNNTIYNSSDAASFDSNSDNNLVYWNDLFNLSNAGVLFYGNNNLVYNNTLTNIINFAIYSAVYNNITDNVITQNNRVGIGIYLSSNNYVTRNQVNNTNQGLYVSGGSSNANVFNNVVSDCNYGFSLIDNNYNHNFSRNNFTNCVYGVYILDRIYNNNFSNNIFENGTYGVYLNAPYTFNTPASENNTFTNIQLYNYTTGIYTNASLLTTNYVINGTFNKSSIQTYGNSSIATKWYLDTQVNDINGLPIQNANVTSYNLFGSVDDTDLTSSGGQAQSEIIEFVQNSSGKLYYTNHTINASISSFSNVTSINFSETNSTNITLSIPISNANCSIINGDTTFTSDLLANGSCIVVNASNLVISGNGATITGNNTGVGINITNFYNITIIGLNLENFSTAIILSNSSNNSITSGTYSNNIETGISFINSNSSVVYTNYFQNNLVNGTSFVSSYDNLIYNNYFSGNTNNSWDSGNNDWNTTLNCSGSSNIIGDPCIGGNYWDDYDGNDSDYNGIGETSYNISGGSNQDDLPLVEVLTSSCQTVNQSISLIPNSLITTTETCFVIAADNIVIDGRNATIQGDAGSDDYGISMGDGDYFAAEYNNVTIKNLNIEEFGYGIYYYCFDGSGDYCYNNTIFNNTFDQVGYGIYGLYLFDNNVSQNTIINASIYGIYLQSSEDNSFYNNEFNNRGIGLRLSTNNTFSSDTINVSDTFNDIYAIDGGTNYFVNTTFNKNNISSAPGTFTYVKWIVNLNITNSTGGEIENVTAVAYRSDDLLEDTKLTNSNGLAQLTLTEFYKENQIKYIATPHQIEATKSGYLVNTSLQTINQSFSFNINLSSFYVGDTIYSDLVLGENLVSNGTAVVIGADNLTITGAGYNLTGNTSGYGIEINGKQNIVINNININNFSEGIYLFQSNNSNLTELNLTNNNYGIFFNTSNNNNVYNSVIGTNSISGVYSVNDGGTNNSLVNVSIDINEINVSGTATLFLKWYVDVNASFGNQSLPLQGATATGYFNSTSLTDNSGITGTDGISQLTLTELKKNSSGITYLTPHDINLTYSTSSANSSNSTIINLSQTNSTSVNLWLNLSCVIPVNDLTLTSNTDICPGTYTVNDTGPMGLIIIGADNINVTCLDTVLIGDDSTYYYAVGIYNNGYENVSVTGCTIDNYAVGIDFISADNFVIDEVTLRNIYFDDNIYVRSSNNGIINGFAIFNLSSYYSSSAGISLDGSSGNVISNGTIISSSGTYNGINIEDYSSVYSNNNNITNVSLSYLETGVRLAQGINNTFRNCTFSNNGEGVLISPYGSGQSINNYFYHNSFSSSTDYHVYDHNSNVSNYFNTSVNISGILYNQGNTWDDYCNYGVDLDNDTYADNVSGATTYDWPYTYRPYSLYKNSSDGSEPTFGVNSPVLDYAPKITVCVSEVQLGGGGGGGSTTAAGSGVVETVKTESKTTKKQDKVVGEVYSAEETKKYLKTDFMAEDENETRRFRFILENTGTKSMNLFPNIFEQGDDPFFMIDKKTLGSENSLFYKIASLVYSENVIAGRLLHATLVNPEEIIIPPGGRVERIIEFKEGLIIPRQIKIQFTTFGETVYEQDVAVERIAVSGSAIDLDQENELMDIYVVIAPEEVFTNGNEIEGNGDSITGNAIVDMNINTNSYTVEMNINSKDGKKNHFSDLYGPYNVKTEQALVFAQQYKYNSEVYADNYQVQTKIYRGNELVTENNFDVEMNDDKELGIKHQLFRVLSWLIPLLFAIISLISVLFIIINKSSKKKSLKKEEL